MLLLITGASGFLGRYVVAAALRQGHEVRAVVRPSTNAAQFAWHHHPKVQLVRLDLRSSIGLDAALEGVDKVIHLAAVKGGDFYDRFAGSVLTTENLLDRMAAADVLDMVAISTFSVYEYERIALGTRLTEASPIESDPKNRDEYAQTKLIQEQLIRDFQNQYGARVVFIRPGMIYGREDLWHALLGLQAGAKTWLCIAPQARMPMTYVENCAQAIIQAAESETAVGQTLNIVDDNPPKRQVYLQELSKQTATPIKMLPANWLIMSGIARLAWFVNQVFLDGQARLPGLLVPAKLQARFKPLKYENTLAKEILGWTPRYSLNDAIRRSLSDHELLNVDAFEPAVKEQV